MEDPSEALVREQQTMLMTLRMHAQDAASQQPILGDQFADGVLERIGVAAQASTVDSNRPTICTRARLIDDIVRELLRRHHHAVVLHLGCGLDSRVLRLDPGPGVLWVEVDQASVMALRRTAYDERAGVRDVAASVTEPDWWSELPTGRPVLAVAEGLLMYLPPEAVREVVTRLLGVDRQAALVADTVAPWVRRIARWHPAFRAAGTGFQSTTADLTSTLSDHGRRSSTASIPRATARFTSGPTSAFLHALCAVPAFERSMLLHRVGPTRVGTEGP